MKPPSSLALSASSLPDVDLPSFASTLAGVGERLAAYGIVVLLAVVLMATIPIVTEPWGAVPAFIPAFQAAYAVNDLITAVLLFGQFREARRLSLLLLACSYLFCASIIVAHTLSFPQLWGPVPLIGGPQTTAWLWFAWHIVPPGAVIIYSLLAASGADAVFAPARSQTAAWSAAILSITGAGLLIFVASAWHDRLPALLNGNQYIPGVTSIVLALPMVASLLALAALTAFTRVRRSLDLWLVVSMVAWSVDILLSAVLNSGRFQAGWYVGRLSGLLASCTVLVSLLLVAASLHGRLARSLALERARADELEQSQAALRQAQKMEAVGQLTAGVAHDFNNLLTGMLGALDILTREKLSERGRRMITLAQQSAGRGATLTQQLLAFSRKQHLQTGPVDLNGLAAGMLDLLRSSLGGAVQLRLDCQSGLPKALADSTQIEIVLLNLTINARDAMPHGGNIVVTTRLVTTGVPALPEEPPPGEWVCLSVADDGEGMPTEVLARVFEPFFTTKAIGRGSGLGLPQVLGVAKQLGGGVTIDSAQGVGSAVHLYLPIALIETGHAPLAAPVQFGRKLAGASILVVDDDANVRGVARAMLEELGCQVVEASGGVAAIDLLAAGPVGELRVDAILLDYAMPEMNGLEAAQHFARLRPGLPILLATGYADTRDLIAGRPYVTDVMSKPYSIGDLLERLGSIVARPGATNVVLLQRPRPTA